MAQAGLNVGNLEVYARKILDTNGNITQNLRNQNVIEYSSAFLALLITLFISPRSSRSLFNCCVDPNVKLQLVSEIRDNMEIVNTGEYGLYLKYLFPVFYNTLRQGNPQLTDGPEQKIRNILLEVLSRLPTTELLK
jgi:hypothetical protein